MCFLFVICSIDVTSNDNKNCEPHSKINPESSDSDDEQNENNELSKIFLVFIHIGIHDTFTIM